MLKASIDLRKDNCLVAFERMLKKTEKSNKDIIERLRHAFSELISEQLLKNGLVPRLDHSISYINFNREKNLISNNLDGDMPAPPDHYPDCRDSKFCQRYGFNSYSVSAINYRFHPFCILPSLFPLTFIEGFSIGNIIVSYEGSDVEIVIKRDDFFHCVSYSYSANPRKHFGFIALYGIWFNKGILSEFLGLNFQKCDHPKNFCSEVQLGIVNFPVMNLCGLCGKIVLCNCFKGYVDAEEIIRYLPWGGSNETLNRLIKEHIYSDGLCALCKNSVPPFIYGNAMYFNTFQQRYLPYYELMQRKFRKSNPSVILQGKILRDIENETRQLFGFPKIGEKWLSELILLKIVQAFFQPSIVIYHYRGKELKGLELDIWIPEKKLAIEYQGQQHYKEIAPWGGKEGLAKRVSNDKKKKDLCKILGYELVFFNYDEELTQDLIESRLAKYSTNSISIRP